MINSTHAIINMEIMLSCHIFTAISGKVPGTHLPILMFGGPQDTSPEHTSMAGWRFSVLVTSPTVTKVTVHLSAAGGGTRRRRSGSRTRRRCSPPDTSSEHTAISGESLLWH